ncbi:MAG: hypothetical protein AAF368_17935, partial [Planctomycetota bacterium]
MSLLAPFFWALAGILSPTLSASAPGLSGSHPGPPLFIEIDTSRTEVLLQLTIEEESWLAWTGIPGPLPSPDFDPGIGERLVLSAIRLFQEERGLDLHLDGKAASYSVSHVEPLSRFGAANAEPAVRIDLFARTLTGEPPASLALTWTLFDQVSDPSKRLVPVLIECWGNYSLLRASPSEPTIRWLAGDAEPHLPPPEALEPLPVLRSAPQLEAWPSVAPSLFAAALAFLSLALFLFKRRQLFAFSSAALLLLFVGLAFQERAKASHRLSKEASLNLFETLHRGVYRAMDARTESAIYDRLAVCVDGELLDELYAEVLRGLTLAEDGDALCLVESIFDTEGELVPVRSLGAERTSLVSEGFAVEW